MVGDIHIKTFSTPYTNNLKLTTNKYYSLRFTTSLIEVLI